MKKFVAFLFAAALVLSLASPTFADDKKTETKEVKKADKKEDKKK